LELNEKLQELRKQKGLTQEELAAALYVSRTAISKWESGRGVPSIDSLKAISKYFDVSIDDLLSGEELLTIADEDIKKRESHIRTLLFGLLDCGMILFLFLPLFAERYSDVIKEATLFSLREMSLYIKILYFAVIFAIVSMGILTLALQNFENSLWVKYGSKISVGLSIAAVVIFIATLQVYAALFSFVFLVIKTFILLKKL
jgi:transcriptional regulator with XRE-family HTH domain